MSQAARDERNNLLRRSLSYRCPRLKSRDRFPYGRDLEINAIHPRGLLPSLLVGPLVRLRFKRLDVPAGRALVGDQLGHGPDAGHSLNRGQAFTQAGAVIEQLVKLG
jgi:hypothetical protein